MMGAGIAKAGPFIKMMGAAGARVGAFIDMMGAGIAGAGTMGQAVATASPT
jgi:hypothetical protein